MMRSATAAGRVSSAAVARSGVSATAAAGSRMSSAITAAPGSGITTPARCGTRTAVTAVPAISARRRRPGIARSDDGLTHIELRPRIFAPAVPRRRLTPVPGIALRRGSRGARIGPTVRTRTIRRRPPPVVPAILRGSGTLTLVTIAGRWRLCRSTGTGRRRRAIHPTPILVPVSLRSRTVCRTIDRIAYTSGGIAIVKRTTAPRSL